MIYKVLAVLWLLSGVYAGFVKGDGSEMLLCFLMGLAGMILDQLGKIRDFQVEGLKK